MNIKQLLRDKDEKNLFVNILLAFLIKGLAMIISFFSMPLYIKYFGNDSVLGLWYTILSMLTWINLFDLGMGNGLRNRLTEALALGDHKAAKEYISSTYAALTVVILPVMIVICAVIYFVDLNAFFNITPDLVSPVTLRYAVLILIFGVAIHFVLKTVTSIVYAIQKPFINNLLTIATSVLPLMYIGFFRGGDAEQNLLALTGVHVISSNLPHLLLTFALFKTRELRECTPSLKACTRVTAKAMLNFGLQFFFAQVTFMFLSSTNEIIITNFFSAADVVDYSIYYRLFTLISSLFMLALTPLWSKVTKDLAQKKYRKIKITNRVLYTLSALAVVAQVVMVFLAQFVVDIWLGDEAIPIDLMTAAVFAFYGSVFIFNVVLTTMANGIGDLKTQVMFYGVGSLLKIPTIWLLSLYIDHWRIVLLYNGVVLLVFCIFQLFWVERKINVLIQRQEQEAIKPEQTQTN